MIQTIILLVIIAIVAFINTKPRTKKKISFDPITKFTPKGSNDLFTSKRRVIKKGRSHTVRFGF